MPAVSPATTAGVTLPVSVPSIRIRAPDGSLQLVNQAYVRAQASSAAYQYGAASVSAYGVGAAIVAGDIGGELLLDTYQTNGGDGVEAMARIRAGGSTALILILSLLG